jgi:hypothetical protein
MAPWTALLDACRCMPLHVTPPPTHTQVTPWLFIHRVGLARRQGITLQLSGRGRPEVAAAGLGLVVQSRCASTPFRPPLIIRRSGAPSRPAAAQRPQPVRAARALHLHLEAQRRHHVPPHRLDLCTRAWEWGVQPASKRGWWSCRPQAPTMRARSRAAAPPRRPPPFGAQSPAAAPQRTAAPQTEARVGRARGTRPQAR